MAKPFALLALALPLVLGSCNLLGGRSAHADLLDPAGAVTGKATFKTEGQGLHVHVQVGGLTPGMHGMHIHEGASCANTTAADGKVTVFGGALGHFDPMHAGHHGSPEASNTQGHAGDIPMLNVGADGNGTADFYTSRLTLSGEMGVVGHSLIIHAAPDDYKTDPSGNSGARERCGVIG